MAFPATRLRRLRASPAILSLVQETRLSPKDFVLPVFVRPGKGVRRPISSMPGYFQYSADEAAKTARAAASAGIPAVILFGIPERKDGLARGAYAKDGVVQRAARAIKQAAPGLLVAAD